MWHREPGDGGRGLWLRVTRLRDNPSRWAWLWTIWNLHELPTSELFSPSCFYHLIWPTVMITDIQKWMALRLRLLNLSESPKQGRLMKSPKEKAGVLVGCLRSQQQLKENGAILLARCESAHLRRQKQSQEQCKQDLLARLKVQTTRTAGAMTRHESRQTCRICHRFHKLVESATGT